MSIWSLKRSRDPDRRLNKHKVQLLYHGYVQQWGVNYWETYSQGINWTSIISMLILSIIREIHTKSVDFVLAYTQDDLKTEISMDPPQVLDLKGTTQ